MNIMNIGKFGFGTRAGLAIGKGDRLPISVFFVLGNEGFFYDMLLSRN